MEYWLALLLCIALGIAGLIVIVLISDYIGQMTSFYFAAPFIMFFFVAVLGVFAYQYGLKKHIYVTFTQFGEKIEDYSVSLGEDGSFNSDDFIYVYFSESGGQATIKFITLVNELTDSNKIKLCRDNEILLQNKNVITNNKTVGNINICVYKKGIWK